MNIQFHRYIPWSRAPNSNKDLSLPGMSAGNHLESYKEKVAGNANFWRWSIFSLIPWTITARDKIQFPKTVNRALKKYAQPRGSPETVNQSTIRFRPYVSKVPWHTGPRGFLSQLFPRYGNYCGPNWSSGKDNGSPIWDKRPIDWLDFCCYCHDIGYDTHDQAELLKADLMFLECLERPHMSTKGDPWVAYLYKSMCISGLRKVMIPYRENLLKLQAGKLSFPSVPLSNIKLRVWHFAKTP